MKKAIKSGYKESSFGGQVKSFDENSRIVSGYFASFNTIDSDKDIILEGAFSKSLNERGVGSESNRQIKYLHQHNILEPIGAMKILKEDSVGLYFEAQLEKTPLGDVVLERYKNGSYREHSIGFDYVFEKCAWSEKEGQDAFLCSELKLYEGSVVTFGANENTPFLGFKGSQEDLMKEIQEQEKFLLKGCKNYEQELTLKQAFARERSLITQIATLKSTIKEKADHLSKEEQNKINTQKEDEEKRKLLLKNQIF